VYGKGTDGRVTGTRRRTKGVRMRTSVIATVHAAVRAVIYMRPIGPVLGCMRVFPCTCDDIGRCDMVLRTHGGRICLMEGTNEL